MRSSTATYIPDILEEHVEELAFLWGQRRTALRDPDYTLREVGFLEERITAHREGVLTVGDHALPLLEESLGHEDPQMVFAAAYSLLHSSSGTAAQRVLSAFRTAEGERLANLAEAMEHAPLAREFAPIEKLCQNGNMPVAVLAATALAFHSALHPTADQLRRFLTHDDPSVRHRGWQLVAYLGAPIDPKTYAAAVRDGDPSVRRAALEAGAWCGAQGVLPVCRKLAAEPTPETVYALEVLAILGGPEDVRTFATVACADALGPSRFKLVGTYGHPGLMDLVLGAIGDSNPAVAVAAAAAFTKMTGQDISSGRRTTLPPEDGSEPDEFEAEFLDEAAVPDPELALRHWNLVKPDVQHLTRLRRSFDVGAGLTAEAFAALDMESRWEISQRARFSGSWQGSPLRLERFPQTA